MNVLDMMTAYRSLSGDTESPPLAILQKLRRADILVFHEIGGMANDEVRTALRTETTETIAPSRPYIVVPSQLTVEPVAYLDGKACHILIAADKIAVANTSGFTPAAVVERTKVTFLSDDYWASGTKEATITYFREPRPMVYMAGYTAEAGIVKFGRRGREGLVSFSFVWPTTTPTVAESELSGATLSLQEDDTYRKDYTIEENEAGPMVRVFVNPTFSRFEYPMLTFRSRDVVRAFPADVPAEDLTDEGEAVPLYQNRYFSIVHRASDLPGKFHQLIVDRAVKDGESGK